MPIPSDQTLLRLNQSLHNAIAAYLEEGVAICFDLPDPDNPPATPTVSVFLYSVQEDLELRHGITRQFVDGKMRAGKVNLKCDYQITYWEARSAEPGSGPTASATSQAMQIMNQVLNALINNRELGDFPTSYTRVIAPQELAQLSHFWQALGNKPRLCLNYSATLPVQLTDHNEVPAAVVETRIDLEQIEPDW